MEKTFSIWQTTGATFSYIKENFLIYFKTLIIPFLIISCTSIPLMMTSANSIPFPSNPPELWVPPPLSPWFGLTQLLGSLLMIWVVNSCYRITLQGKATYKWWTMRETWTLLWMIFIGIITTLGALIPSGIVFSIMSALGFPLAGGIIAGLMGVLLFSYLIGRLCVIFPSIAVGEDLTLKQTWALSEGQGWRIIILLGFLPFIPMFIGSILIFVLVLLFSLLSATLAEALVMLSYYIISFAVICISTTALGLVYKQLK